MIPNIVSGLKYTALLVHSKLNLTCIANGDPNPFFYWTKDGSRDVPRAQLSDGNTTLVIGALEIADEGTYTCAAINRAGKDSSSAFVVVKGKLLTHF